MMSETPPPGRRPRSLWIRIVRLPILAYLSVLLLMTLLERRLVYPVPPLNRSDWSVPGDHEDVEFASADGVPLHGWFYDHASPKHAILYCHGNGAQVADRHELMLQLRERYDAAVFVFDYRGYGKSGGKPYEAGVVADGIAAAEWLARRTERRVDELVVIGVSLGGGVATAVAAERGAGALVLQSTFTRITDAAAVRFPWLPVHWLMRNRYDSLARLKRYDGPLLVSHGTADRVVPFEQGRRLFDTSPSEFKQFVELPGKTHNQPHPNSYFQTLKTFLEEASAPSP